MSMVVRQQLIETYMPLAVTVSRKFAKYLDADEAKSIALLKLTSACMSLPLEEITMGKLYTVMYSELRGYCWQWRRGVIKMGRVKGPEFRVYGSDKQEIKTEDMGFERVDFKDMLKAHINSGKINKVEKLLIDRLIEGGYTITEIAKECGVSKQYISKIKEKVCHKLLKSDTNE